MIELYDVGRTLQRPVPGMFKFAIDQANRYAADPVVAADIQRYARVREQGGLIPQVQFERISDIVAQGYRRAEFSLDPESLIYPDVIARLQRVRARGSEIGILTAASREFTDIFLEAALEGQRLGDLVDRIYFGSDTGDKEETATFVRLWEKNNGDIAAVFDDKLSVCNAAAQAFEQVKTGASVYLVDRKGAYRQERLRNGIIRIESLADIRSEEA